MKKSDKKSEWANPGEYRPSYIGGQALLEGVMMRGKTAAALCCRDEKGELTVYTERNNTGSKWYRRVPIVRGVVSFFSSLVGGVKYINKSAEVYAGDEKGMGKGGMFIAVALAVVLALALFIGLPMLLNWLILDLWIVGATGLTPSDNLYVLIMCLLKGFFRVVILILYLWLTSKLKDIKRTYMYHGAEHRTINCYEHGLELTVENVQKCSTRHARCGTTFMFYTVLISVFIMTLVTWIISLCGLSRSFIIACTASDALGGFLYNLICIGIGIACLPIIAGLSYELLRLIAKAPDNKFFMIFKAPGFALQALTTKKPDDDMAEAAIVAFKKVLEMDENPGVPTVNFYEMTAKDARKYLEEQYAAAGIDDPSEVDWMLCEALGVKRNELAHITKLDKAQTARLKQLCGERVTGKPLDYVTGRSDFLGYELAVDENVHLPRMETETTALIAADIINKQGLKSALDLMTGSGCIARALAERTAAEITASDISQEALNVAVKNLPERVKLVRSDCFADIEGSFDLIVSNPPYIRTDEIDGLQREVTCQPRIALDGGADGLDFYRRIAEEAPSHLVGTLVLEIGHDQAKDVCGILEKSFTDIRVEKDLSGSDRVIVARKREAWNE